jgi:uncharacterized membrane protein (Fun14 family)
LHGFVAGLPAIEVMAIPFVLGIIVGYLLKKILKIAIIAAIILFIVTYLGFFDLSFNSLKNLVTEYGPIAAQYAVLILGILPLSAGLIIGVIIGFLI